MTHYSPLDDVTKDNIRSMSHNICSNSVPNPRATPDLLQGHHQAGSMSHPAFVNRTGLDHSTRSATQTAAVAAPTTSAATTASSNPLATFDSILGMSDQRQLELGMTS